MKKTGVVRTEKPKNSMDELVKRAERKLSKKGK